MFTIPQEYVDFSDGSISGYDIAFLVTRQTITIDNKKVQRAQLPTLPNPTAGTMLYTAGWGVTELGEISDNLKGVCMVLYMFLENVYLYGHIQGDAERHTHCQTVYILTTIPPIPTISTKNHLFG